ncbi:MULTISPECIES: hypothetical protein [Streptomyces]|uniref:Uncharacterized protein n=1 Tax=Streptomyces pseudovenezuelae TaxID=67350 RepID=A0ABT6M1E8_9ACTN|nr:MULTISPECIES: hypothetical protein [Streptomyces]MDC0773356.1 hypothetical protein [Streptomyces sp. HD]MDH6222378.1 hypothetical protein [Streptomyces pseudovenezuelae]SOE06554.1 hypothetical protein SAMN06272765_7386 [Streptomyces sp. Ag109_G2-15]
MRATKHAAPQPWRRRGMVTGIPLALLVAAVQPDVAQPTGVRFARP